MKRTSPVVFPLLNRRMAAGIAGAEEEIRGQADHGFEKIFLYELLPDLPLGRAPEEHAMGNDHADAARALAGGLDHVGDEAPVPLRLRRQATVVAVEGIGGGFLITPLVEGEGRIGDHDIKFHELIALHQPGH